MWLKKRETLAALEEGQVGNRARLKALKRNELCTKEVKLHHCYATAAGLVCDLIWADSTLPHAASRFPNAT